MGMTQPWTLTALKAPKVSWAAEKLQGRRGFCPSRLMRTHLQGSIQLWGHSTARMWNCWSKSTKGIRSSLIAALTTCRKDGQRLFTRTWSDRTRRNGLKPLREQG